MQKPHFFCLWTAVIFLNSSAFALEIPENIQQSSRNEIKSRSLFLDESKINPGDEAEDLVDLLRYRKLEDMETANLLLSQLTESPWSDSYWPIYQGTLANRYNDERFPAVDDWKVNTDYVKSHLGRGSNTDQLSPAEKYDLIMGDTNFSLTKAQIAEGRYYYEQTKSVETWMGLCHGWAPASYMVDRPLHSVDVMSGNGEMMIHLYPSDIKALITLLWSNGNVPTRFVGGRCNEKDAPLDRLGRPTGNECLDNNPGTWHLAIVNQIGVNKRSFVMDATWLYQVWNQPVFGYSYVYFNPITGVKGKTLKRAQVKIQDYQNDPYRAVRAPEARSIVGVEMTTQYIVETEPTSSETNSSQEDAVQAAKYRYDIELDQDGNIVGGEWLNKEHPDFLWTPEKDAKAMSPADLQLDRSGSVKTWNGKAAVPSEWQTAAPGSSNRSLPLGRVVYSLIELSRGGQR